MGKAARANQSAFDSSHIRFPSEYTSDCVSECCSDFSMFSTEIAIFLRVYGIRGPLFFMPLFGALFNVIKLFHIDRGAYSIDMITW